MNARKMALEALNRQLSWHEARKKELSKSGRSHAAIGWEMLQHSEEVDALTVSIAELEADIAQADTKDASSMRLRKELAGMHHDLLVVMQAAWIEWQHGKGAESAMQWIENTLAGPGLIPYDDEPYSNEPQAYFDKNKSNPFPECFCGRPSNQLWMGKGFCGDYHYKEHRAAASKATGGAA